jgi:hypothetical protein
LKAVALIEEKLFDLEARDGIEDRDIDGRFEDDRDFLWEAVVEPHKELPLNIVDIAVNWDRGPGRQNISVATYMWKHED